jgi:hypothetical protein
MQTNKQRAVTYSLITQRTEAGIIVKPYCLTRKQYKQIKRAGNVVIRNIGKANFKLLTAN